MTMIRALAAVLILTTPIDVIDRIMAVVGTQPITLSDVAGVTQFRLIPIPSGTRDPIGYVLDKVIDRTVMLAEVDRFQPPEPDPIEITIRIDQMQAAAGSPAAFDTMLAVTGMTREQLRRFVRDTLRMETYVNQRFGTILDPRERDAAIASWIADLRRRAQITVLYRPGAPTPAPSR